MNKNANFWANLSNKVANLCVNLPNLKTLFALPKYLKIFLIIVSTIFTLGIIITITLNTLTKDKIYSANLIIKSQNALDSSDKIAYHIWIDAPKFKPLLRSRSVSSVNLAHLLWDGAINQNAIENLRISGIRLWFESTQDLQGLGLESLGSVAYKVDFYPLLWSLVRYFVNILVAILVFWVIWKLTANLLRSLPPKNDTIESTARCYIERSEISQSRDISFSAKTQYDKNLDSSVASLHQNDNLTRNDYTFLMFAFALCAGICGFSFWLGFPGFHIIGDTYNSIATIKDNAHPVFIAYIMEILYALFGKNLYYLFLFNLMPFYLGLFFLIAGFYLRFKNPFALLLIFPTFIGNIYFQNFIQYHSFALPMMLFCIYSALLFLILVPLNTKSKREKILAKILWFLLFMLMLFAILWRHNAIFSVFPAFLIIVYLFLKNRNLDSKIFAKIYFKLVALSAGLCLAVVIIIPHILQTSKSHPANHPFLHQIAGACVPANNESCFKKEWYYPHKGWSDVKTLYAKYPLNADPFNVSWGYDDERPFKPEKLQGLQTQWLKAIIKYPRNFLTHEARFFKAMWWQEPKWIFNDEKMQTKATHKWHISVLQDFKESQRSIAFSPLQEKIYTFLFNHKILLNHAWGVGVGFVILVLSSVVLWRRRKIIFANTGQNSALLVFCFSVSFASFFSAFFIAAFSPVPETRYMSPILPMSIVAFVGFIAFALESCKKRARI